MRSTCLLDSTALASFLVRSQQADFAFSGQWARLLTLECALQTLERERSTARRPD
jgi:hypothetical protein